jgi:riboflavin kinase
LTDYKLLSFLIELTTLGAHEKTVRISTTGLAERMSVSQQTVSRRLIELEKKKLIERRLSHHGEDIRLTERGVDTLREVYTKLKEVFTDIESRFTIKGEVFEGYGEGAYYMSRRGYYTQFIEKLGFQPFPGTLNLKLTRPHDLEMRRQLDLLPGVKIEGFDEDDRAFGSVRCFKAVINEEINGAVILISRTHYSFSTLEVISAINLRKQLNLQNGDNIAVRILLDSDLKS